MAQEYSFTQQERNNLFAPTKVYSSFGRDQLNDFMMLHVYDTDGNLIVTKVLGLNEVSFENDGDFIDINVGQHLRDLGFQEGEYSSVQPRSGPRMLPATNKNPSSTSTETQP